MKKTQVRMKHEEEENTIKSHWGMVVCLECFMLSDRGLGDGPITHPEQSCRLWCVIVCDVETSEMRRPWPALGCCAKEKKEIEEEEAE